MTNRLADAVSPYLRSHAGNPVDWWQWGPEPFAEAERRGVPVLISIGYSTCHWCHVMARESFSDPVLAEYLNANFVSIKVDREEHPDVDSTYMATAGAFTQQLGWPLTVFATPAGRTFFAGTYYPPQPVQNIPAFRQVLEAVQDAWTNRRSEVDANAAQIANALAAQSTQKPGPLPTSADFNAIVSELRTYEDTEFGGFGGAPKFPVATVIGLLLDREDAGDAEAGALARRTLTAMANSELRDSVEGGFFRYAVHRDWSEPHYERMLYDNALLLDAYARVGDTAVADGIASFLLNVLALPGGGLASAQDSESILNGVKVEGDYYKLSAEERAAVTPPALDDKVLTGWNGLAIGALASAGYRLGRPDWVEGATKIADYLLDGPLIRARTGEAASTAQPTLEDYGMLADGLASLAIASGEVSYAVAAREILSDAMAAGSASPFGVPTGGDPVLTAHGLMLEVDPSEGAYPSGISAAAHAALTLYGISGDAAFRDASRQAMEILAPLSVTRAISFGFALSVMSALNEPTTALVLVDDTDNSELAAIARTAPRTVLVAQVTSAQAQAFAEAGFELFVGRTSQNGLPTAYLCESFVCHLPVTDAEALRGLLS
ncbi:MAG TPA: thioredoxin domain-containing protein [Glaciihabitans sp.]|jgi:uncharacterized protein YyaL (SSP411 family)|nr:thioredoxin domain-containing protein [Glaciihabitans sp.]